MPHQIAPLLEEKLNTIQAHAKCINLFLSMELEAQKGNENFKSLISEITTRLPKSHHASSDKRPIQSFLVGQTFISLISEFEGFLVDIMIWVLRKHPQKIGAETFKLSEVLEFGGQSEIIRIAAERHINQLMYKRATEYRKSFVEMLSAEPDFLQNYWPAYVEFKARRDLGVHNGWIINDTYIRKVKEVGINCNLSGPQPPTNDYFWNALETLSEAMGDIADHCVRKFE
jgi:hypothetical protein